ncbi:uncharacterized protein C8R40DRAFT_1168287 [Lentinula edodes]|uniref:uncharacterized protein n=1 Tax=Lentinula edodes TaxID=5353 RepID=UPI001E8CF116|nr:uncharacterized protein C8R40DRAFT_1168287 [Lentinula edodes]KAH7877559.1 hypothetical protein C8R40DRAFT_1168287 [Lentinula edodes]
MRNPFLIIRFIFLSLLSFLNLLNLIFASWNASAAINANIALPGASLFLVFNSVTSIFFLGLGLLELVAPNFAGTSVAFESGWSAVLSLSSIGSAIGVTISAAIFIRQTTESSVTASSFLLMPTTWLTSLTMLGYFFILFVSAMTHASFEEEIWTKPVCQVKWFGYTNSRLRSSDVSNPRELPGLENDSWARYLDGIESSGVRKARHPVTDPEKAPWASTHVRRGRDSPFRTPIKREDSDNSDTSSDSSFSLGARDSAPLPPLPLNVQVKGSKSVAGSRFIERFRESQTLSRPTRPVIDFPHEVDDHDKPIPLTRLSQWIRADAIKAFSSRH